MIGTAGLTVLSVVGLGRHTMALGGFGRANVVFAIADRGCGGGHTWDRPHPRPRPGGDELIRSLTATGETGSGGSCYGAFPAELGCVPPHTVEDDRELPGHGDLRFLEA